MIATDTPLSILDSPPARLFELGASELTKALSGPTLIKIAGRGKRTIFCSLLLHGNETSGWTAFCRLMRELPVPDADILLFIGNVQAAAAGVRCLPDQTDFNRVWNHASGPEQRFVRELVTELERHDLFAAIDLHNNTGHNPHYAVLTNLDRHNLELAGLFSDKAVYVEEPDTVITKALEALCPAIAVEVGPVDEVMSDERAFAMLEVLAQTDEIPPLAPDELTLFRAVARVHVNRDITYGFAGQEPIEGQSLTLTGGIEAVNFHALPAGTEFGETTLSAPLPVIVLDPLHRDVTNDFFELREHHLVLRQSTTPAMYTTDKDVVRQDCLCYFMETMAQP